MNITKLKVSVIVAVYAMLAGAGSNAMAVEISQSPVFIGSEGRTREPGPGFLPWSGLP